jgi:hypothetical protein
VFFPSVVDLRDLQIAITFEPSPTCFLQIDMMHTKSVIRGRCATSELILSTFCTARGAGDKVVGQLRLVQNRILLETAFDWGRI